MDRMLYLAATGATQIMHRQAANTHNLANASTTGFQADLSAARAMPVFGEGHASRVYAMAERPGVDFSRGTLMVTGRELDVAVNGDGWIAVQGADGREAYTRAGDLRVNSAGQLTNGAGHAVLGDAGPLVIPPYESLEIGGDGTVTIRPIGQAPNTLAEVGRIKLVDHVPGQLEKGEDGLLRSRDGNLLPPSVNVSLLNGNLESSNVSMVEAMTNMIELSRSFEMQIKLMKTAEDNDAQSARMMQMS
ncbi:MAG: flagellar basal body rod protein FlgF [Xanthomonadaceae bacterium]|nr:flagellar basal body rod protein FlgF [Xanthomonadaceae bacterium]